MSTNGSINVYFIVNKSDGTLWRERVWRTRGAATQHYNASQLNKSGSLTDDDPVRVEWRTLYFPEVPSATWDEIKEATTHES